MVSVFTIFPFYFFIFQISFCIYLLLALLIFFYHFHNNLLLYLVLRLSFFDNKLNSTLTHFIYNEKIYKTPLLSVKLEPFIISIASSLPQDFEILGWCPAEPVLPHGEKVPL